MQTSRLVIALKALRELGPVQMALNGLYKFGLASGHYLRAIHPPKPVSGLKLKPILPVPGTKQVRATLGENGLRALLAEADEIVAGKYRQFGAEPVALMLAPPGPLAHWTAYESGEIDLKAQVEDIKLVWEPARFGWAFVLGRAYHASGEEKYAQAFWQYFETFNQANLPYLGPNWTSAQEVGLRLMAWVWAGQIFSGSAHSSPARREALAAAVATHAARIPATLPYARSQNNNHLLTEAAALLSAALALPEHPHAVRWLKIGRKWLAWCFTNQIDEAGEYVQHSTNYQRLMLQIALWVQAISGRGAGGEYGQRNLSLAARWLVTRLDPLSGQAPNLGANDGALIFPLAGGGFSDYRPVAQAAARAFLTGAGNLPRGAWDEMSLWFGLPRVDDKLLQRREAGGQLYAKTSWGSLRVIQFTSRPSHADLLHCELWWRGLNIAQDAGTYRYNAAPPWDNRLSSTLVHNTLSVNGEEQMTRAGRFLYLDWARASYELSSGNTDGPNRHISAFTNAYARFGVRHNRSLTVFKDERWLVEDELLYSGRQGPDKSAPVYRLHWLLPDWEWKIEYFDARTFLRIRSPHGWVNLAISTDQPVKRVGLLRAGELVHGQGLVSPVFGWVSPTYNVKKPALSLEVEVQSSQNVRFSSEFSFPSVE
jgi:hypothetical protein